MAVSGAHLTSTVGPEGEDGEKPSIFEVLAQESLMSSLQPALKHALQVIAQRNPARYGWLYAFSDELYTCLHLVLENHYLKRYSASFSENFYGLKRIPTQPSLAQTKNSEETESSTSSSQSHAACLPMSNHLRSLVCLVMVPYLKGKCDQLYERLAENSQINPAAASASRGLRDKLCRAFLAVYPILHLLYEGAILMCQMAYIFGKSSYHTPLLRLAGVLLSHLNDDDLARHNKVQKEPLSIGDQTWLQRLSLLGNKALATLAVAVSSGLSVGVFFLQFLEWWYASDQHATSLTALPMPSPPKCHIPEGLPKLSSVCPLCHKIRTNDTVLAVTGYVFCYPCIYMYVRDNSSCPVTGYPANLDHLVKLYLPDG